MLLHVDSKLWSDWVDAQADLSLRWAHKLILLVLDVIGVHWVHMPFCWFWHEAAQIILSDIWQWLLLSVFSAHEACQICPIQPCRIGQDQLVRTGYQTTVKFGTQVEFSLQTSVVACSKFHFLKWEWSARSNSIWASSWKKVTYCIREQWMLMGARTSAHSPEPSLFAPTI